MKLLIIMQILDKIALLKNALYLNLFTKVGCWVFVVRGLKSECGQTQNCEQTR